MFFEVDNSFLKEIVLSIFFLLLSFNAFFHLKYMEELIFQKPVDFYVECVGFLMCAFVDCIMNN